jgi:hypothetical protein
MGEPCPSRGILHYLHRPRNDGANYLWPPQKKLLDHIRQTIPQPKAMLHIKPREDTGIVEFTWNARHFVVKTTLQVFELKGSTILITGASMLMQATLQTRDRHGRVIEAIIELLQAAEENAYQNPAKSFPLLAQVKTTLTRLVGKPSRGSSSPRPSL